MNIRDVDEEVKEYGWYRFLEDYKKVERDLTGRQQMLLRAIDYDSISWSRYVEEPNEANWLTFYRQIQNHRVYVYVDSFADDYYTTIRDTLDLLKRKGYISRHTLE